jgi:hypothetical protein
MRRLMLVVAVLSFVWLPLASCIIAPRPGYQRQRQRQRNCYRSCAAYSQRRRCTRRCQVYRNGVCVSYRQVCKHTRYCSRYRSRCR